MPQGWSLGVCPWVRVATWAQAAPRAPQAAIPVPLLPEHPPKGRWPAPDSTFLSPWSLRAPLWPPRPPQAPSSEQRLHRRALLQRGERAAQEQAGRWAGRSWTLGTALGPWRGPPPLLRSHGRGS